MDDLESKATWILVLFPGVLSMGIVAQIVGLGDLGEAEVFFVCIFFTVIDVGFAVILSRFIVWLCTLDGRPGAARAVFAACVLIVSVLVGIGAGLAAEGDLFFVALRSLPLTNTLNKRSRDAPLAFLLAQNTRGELKQEGDARPLPNKVTEAFVRIKIGDDKLYEGWPEFYSASIEHVQIYLSPACIVFKDKDGGGYVAEKITGPGVLLFSSEIQYVEFIDRAASPCFAKWYPSSPNPGATSPTHSVPHSP